MEAVTNGQTIEWYKVKLENGKISEAKIKTEAVKFFDLSDEEQSKDKKVFKKRIEDFVENQKNIEKKGKLKKQNMDLVKIVKIPLKISSLMLSVKGKGDWSF